MTPSNLAGLLITESIIIFFTIVFAIFEVWNVFAFMALLDVLLPLWIIAVAACVYITDKEVTHAAES